MFDARAVCVEMRAAAEAVCRLRTAIIDVRHRRVSIYTTAENWSAAHRLCNNSNNDNNNKTTTNYNILYSANAIREAASALYITLHYIIIIKTA